MHINEVNEYRINFALIESTQLLAAAILADPELGDSRSFLIEAKAPYRVIVRTKSYQNLAWL